MKYQVRNETDRLLLLQEDDEIGYLKYKIDEEQDYIIESIFVNEKYRGLGYATIILNEFISIVEKKNRKIIPICSFAKKQFEKRDEIKYLLKNK